MAGRNGKLNSDTVGMVGVRLIIISWIVALFVDNLFILKMDVVAIVIGVLCVGYYYISAKKERTDGIQKRNNNLQDFQNEYDSYANKLGVVKSGTQVILLDGAEKIPQHIWIADNKINMFPVKDYYEMRVSAITKPSVTDLKLRSILTEDIWYFEEYGELRKYASVSGGGISLKGALVGKVLAGDAGMIIGSRESIRTEVVSEDDRIVELIYENSEEVENLEFTHDSYAVLKKLIPDKELRRIRNLQQTNI